MTLEPVRLVGDYLVPGEGEGTVVVGGAVDIGADGRIVAVGPEPDLGPAPGTVRRVGGLLMPGLVNTHAHTPMTLVRSVGDGLPLARWLKEGVWPLESRFGPDDVRAAMTLGSAEMLLAGITSSCEMYVHEEAIVEAVRHTGGRLMVTPGVIAVFAEDGSIEGRIDEIDVFWQSHHAPDDRISVGFAPHSIYDLTPEQCGEIARRAQAHDALFHIHLDETQAERDLVIKLRGRSGAQLLAEHGALEGKVIAAHGVWLDDTDRRLFAEAGAAIAHCPQSNLKLGSGIANVPQLLDAGVRVAVGTDGPASNDDLDMWEDMRLAVSLARGSLCDPEAMTATTALDLATREAARAIHLADVGELRAGAWADVIRVDLDVPAFTPLRPEILLDQLVFVGSGRFVTDVWVAGELVVDKQRMTTVDVDELMADCHRRAANLTS